MQVHEVLEKGNEKEIGVQGERERERWQTGPVYAEIQRRSVQ